MTITLPWGKQSHPENPFLNTESPEFKELAAQFTLHRLGEPLSMMRDPADPSRTFQRTRWKLAMAWEKDRRRQLKLAKAKRVVLCEICAGKHERLTQDWNTIERRKLGKICRVCRTRLRRLNSAIPGISAAHGTLDQYIAWKSSQRGRPSPSREYQDFPHEGFLRYLQRHRTRSAGPER